MELALNADLRADRERGSTRRSKKTTQIYAQMKKNMSKLLYAEISYQIRGACFWIWKEFGSAHKESIVDNALSLELKRRGLKVEDQKSLNIYYQGKKVGTYRPDKIINEAIIIELKTKPYLTKQDVKQFWRYLKGTNYKVGFLINFGEKLEIQRVVYDSARNKVSDGLSGSFNDNLGNDPRGNLRKKSARGSAAFTLIELLVAMAVFSIIILAIGGIFTSALKSQRKVLAIQNSQENARFILEYMTKEIRMSEINSATASALNLTNSKNQNITYNFNSASKILTRTVGATAENLNSSDMEITGGFYIYETGLSSKVTIVMKIQNKNVGPAEQSTIDLQSTVAARSF